VTKLLNLVQPEQYFGQKDAQQLAIIQRLVKDLNLPVKLLPVQLCAASGLALSSNQYLTTELIEQAATLYRGLHKAEQAFHAGERLARTLIEVVKTRWQR